MARQSEREIKIRYQLNVRQRVIDAMGGACECCGEREPKFLVIDHIKGLEGKARPKGQMIYFLVRREGYPRDKYRLLCQNCNSARSNYGACPHRPDDVWHHRPQSSRKLCVQS